MAWPFLDKVDPDEVPDYYQVIKDPMGKAYMYMTEIYFISK